MMSMAVVVAHFFNKLSMHSESVCLKLCLTYLKDYIINELENKQLMF